MNSTRGRGRPRKSGIYTASAPATVAVQQVPAQEATSHTARDARRLTDTEILAMERMFISSRVSVDDIADAFKVAKRSVQRYKRLFEEQGSITQRKLTESWAKFKPIHLEKCLELLEKDSSLEHRHLQAYLLENFDLKVSRSLLSAKLKQARANGQLKRPGQPQPPAPVFRQSLPSPIQPPQPENPLFRPLAARGRLQPPAPVFRQSLPMPGQIQPPAPDSGPQTTTVEYLDGDDADADADDDSMDQSGENGLGPPRNGTDFHAQAADGRPLFVCPFFRKEPHAYQERFCRAGYVRINDLKHHLYRNHCKPRVLCFRCDSVFNEAKDLETHQRQPAACQLRPLSFRGGLDEEQERKVRKQPPPHNATESVSCWHKLVEFAFPGSLPNTRDAKGTGLDPYLWESERVAEPA